MSGSRKTKYAENPSRVDTDSYQPGKDPQTDAWHTIFLIENHLDFYGYPEMVASPEQVRFMVCPGENERYYPCSDETFNLIVGRERPAYLDRQYDQIHQRLLQLIDERIPVRADKDFLKALIGIKFKHETQDRLIIPSRLEKRLLRIFLNWSHIADPWLDEKTEQNRRAAETLQSPSFRQALNHIDPAAFKMQAMNLAGMKQCILQTEFNRLLALSTENHLWKSDSADKFTQKDFLSLFDRHRIQGSGLEALYDFLSIGKSNDISFHPQGKKILWLADEAGEIMIDIAIIRFLTRLGHKVLIAFKQGPLYNKIDIQDAAEDPTLKHELQAARFIHDSELSKNELLRILTSDDKIFVFSDGTREILNLLLASTTFARIFREVDGIISRGIEQKNRLFETHFQFTQDIFNLSIENDKSITVAYKAKHTASIKFSHQDLENKSQEIINQMIAAKKRGNTVIFYSAIIGSIPGRIVTAKRIIAVFIDSMIRQSAGTFIINPSEYYEPGMDADDLMYMWEIVQRSGYIDIWRFQTYKDIVDAFQIMQKKVPPEWVGKDATYSTGCTKEMAIALDVQQKHPEMQIIGPAKEKFMRRKEYGIGKMFDRCLNGTGAH